MVIEIVDAALRTLTSEQLLEIARAHYEAVESLAYNDEDEMDPIDADAVCSAVDLYERMGVPLSITMVAFRFNWREANEDDGGSAGSLVIVPPVEG